MVKLLIHNLEVCLPTSDNMYYSTTPVFKKYGSIYSSLKWLYWKYENNEEQFKILNAFSIIWTTKLKTFSYLT
jgi:hypothetical protein